ncbi:protein LYRIC isoform X2 [Latimeria chalumnae]|uniref:Metadherin n=1 Tax=Latimeria chalumnae TaxID=7897 RepID=M3XIC1_LATCH|nr:PREDICTED: protein LYRIC-like isoform X1 [Latimeria chalumnae]|eukprot:XP_006001160.1 PREDICTED: protein LYRIC-like isoform X1 [Latimeria chalumnae]
MFDSLVRCVLEAGEGFYSGNLSHLFFTARREPSWWAWVLLCWGGVALYYLVAGLLRGRGQRPGSSSAAATLLRDELSDAALSFGLERGAASGKKARQPEEQKRKKRKEKGKEAPNGHAPVSLGTKTLKEEIKQSAITEKKQVKPKKKKKLQQAGDRPSKDDRTLEQEKRDEEEEGRWVMQMSSREKRQLRKERLRQKENTSSRSPRASASEPASGWDNKSEKETEWLSSAGAEVAEGSGWSLHNGPVANAGWAVPPMEFDSGNKVNLKPSSSMEDDIFANVGTWNIAEVKTHPVTFGTLPDLSLELGHMDGTSSQNSPSRCHWHTTLASLAVDDAWLGLDDPFSVDLNSDWSPPVEEWGNWTGENIAGQEMESEKQKGLTVERENIELILPGNEKLKQRKKKKSDQPDENPTKEENSKWRRRKEEK